MLRTVVMLLNNKEAKDLQGTYCTPTSTHYLAYTNPQLECSLSITRTDFVMHIYNIYFIIHHISLDKKKHYLQLFSERSRLNPGSKVS